MKHNKCLVISINSLDEPSGGGIYLKSILHLLNSNFDQITLIDKNIGRSTTSGTFCNNRVSLKKNITKDVISRLFLIPSFYLPHIPLIIRFARRHDVIALHNSRLGLLLLFLRTIFPKKKFILFSDNTEYKLEVDKASNINPFSLAWFSSILERSLIYINELAGYKHSDISSFITKCDWLQCKMLYKIQDDKPIIITPVVIDGLSEQCGYDLTKTTDIQFRDTLSKLLQMKRLIVLFTGSFNFYPNIDAYSSLIRSAKNNPDVSFVVAGKSAAKLKVDESLSNVFIFSDTSDEEMDTLYRTAHVFYSPIKYGSGMKTKIAEALKYGLRIVATQFSLIGYDEILDVDSVMVIGDDEVINFSWDMFDFSKDNDDIKQFQRTYYSPARFTGNELFSLNVEK